MTRSKHEAYFAQLWEQQAAKRERFAAGGSPQSTSGGNTNTPRGASACSPCVASHGESACGVQVDSEARCGAPDPVAVPTQRGRASSIHAPSEKVPAGSESPLSAGLRSTSGGVEADTRKPEICPAGMPGEETCSSASGFVRSATGGHQSSSRAGVAPGPLTLNAAAKDARPSTSRGGVVPVPTFLAVAPIQRAKADAGRVGQLGNEPCGRPGGERPGAASSAPLYALVHACRQAGLSEPVPEYQFHPLRRWRFDYAWPLHLVAVEIEGGIWTQGRHTRGPGVLADMEKYNAAALLGWRLLRYSPQTLGQAVDDLRVMLAGRSSDDIARGLAG